MTGDLILLPQAVFPLHTLTRTSIPGRLVASIANSPAVTLLVLARGGGSVSPLLYAHRASCLERAEFGGPNVCAVLQGVLAARRTSVPLVALAGDNWC